MSLLFLVMYEAPLLPAACHHRALILEFTLRSSTYATMAVRELLRLDTSAHHQASLNSATMSQPPLLAVAGDKEGPSGSTGSSGAAGDCDILEDSELDQKVEGEGSEGDLPL